jgi:hypothetical protein
MVQTNALAIKADTGPWLKPVQYERIARAAGNARTTNVCAII